MDLSFKIHKCFHSLLWYLVNKKGTKFVSARKTIPNVNLRGKPASVYVGIKSKYTPYEVEIGTMHTV